MAGWQKADLKSIPPTQAGWGTHWKSVRNHFGITAFGINAVTRETGEVLIPEHDESESGQEEIFFVHEGEAAATIDGESVKVPAGTIVFVEPAAKRTFAAAASPTTLLVVGSPVGRSYEPPAWDQP